MACGETEASQGGTTLVHSHCPDLAHRFATEARASVGVVRGEGREGREAGGRAAARKNVQPSPAQRRHVISQPTPQDTQLGTRAQLASPSS